MRVHLPVAPKCNIQCVYCNRLYSCPNENRPGVTSTVLSPQQALYYFEALYRDNKDISVVGIAGPGDALANAPQTFETIRLIRERGIDVLFCLATNGLALPQHMDDIKKAETSHVTITINAIEPQVGAKIYQWIRDGKKVYRETEGAQIIIDRQLQSIGLLKDLGIIVKVNAILIPGVNDWHMETIAQEVQKRGADIFNCMPLYPVKGTKFESMREIHPMVLSNLRKRCSNYLPQMKHCMRCRSDAAGFLHEGIRPEFKQTLEDVARMPLNPFEQRDYVAVATTNDFVVNQHLGQADDLTIFKKVEDSYMILETRPMPKKGKGDARWSEMADILKDCKAVLVSGVGQKPREVLQKSGLNVYQSDARIHKILGKVFDGGFKENIRLFEPQPCPGPESLGYDIPSCGSCQGCEK
jgi:nitrogen fixation protein NifB